MVPANVPWLLLSATITPKIRDDILSVLSLKPEFIYASPDRPNIFLHFSNASVVSQTLNWLIDELLAKKERTSKTLVYGKTINACTKIFLALHCALSLDVQKMKLISKFYADDEEEDKMILLNKFKSPSSSVRVLVTAKAFGMGIQIDDVINVIHWGPSSDVLSYWQDVGRCGRGCKPGNAYLYSAPRSALACNTSDDMRNMVKELKKENKCFITLILNSFVLPKELVSAKPPCSCCFICKEKCKCSK